MFTENACTSFKWSAKWPTQPSCRPAETVPGRLRVSQLATCLALMLPIGVLSNEIQQTTAWPSSQINAKWTASTLPWLNATATYDVAALRRGPRPRQVATTLIVTRCTDSGPGTLREAASFAQSDDLIDMTHLQCAVITLTSGEIPLAADNITLRGPGASSLTIDAGLNSRIFRHSGHGVFGIYGVRLHDGLVATDPSIEIGGCVYSSGSIVFDNSAADLCRTYQTSLGSTTPVSGGALAAAGYIFLQNSTLTYSGAKSIQGSATGGAIYAGGDVYLVDSTIEYNSATSHDVARVRGGGIFATGNVVMNRSTVSYNTVYSGPDPNFGVAYGGGIYCAGYARGARGTQIVSSTISGNSSHNVGGAEIVNGNGTNYNAAIVNSTISGNYATYRGGGLVTSTPMTLSNSTIAHNYAVGSTAAAGGFETYASVVMQSSIISNNYAGHFINDFYAVGLVSGSNNLITVTTTAPPGTISEDPFLLKLADNGGPTKTHALASDSLAIDHGNNVAGLGFDQRGPGFLRVVGGATDIGAFEFLGDRVFANSFEPGG